MKIPCREYRDYLRGVRVFLEPQHEAMLMGEPVSNLQMTDLEALYELIIGTEPVKPVGYRPSRQQRK